MRQPVAHMHVAQPGSDSAGASTLRRLHRVQHGLTLAFIVVIGVALRLYLIHQPLHYDEAYTYLHFASRGIRAVITDYHAPNNHVLHSVLVRFSYGVFGHDPWALRVPAAAAGVLLIPAVYVVGRLFHGSAAGLIAAAITSGSGLMIGYSVNARGYSIIVLLFMVLCLLAWRMVHADTGRRLTLIGYGVAAALGFFTIPVMAYPVGATSLWILAIALRLPGGTRDRILRDLTAALTLGGLLTVALYAPILLRMPGALIRNDWVTHIPLTELLWQMPFIPIDIARSWMIGVPVWLGALLLGGLVAGMVQRERRAVWPLWIPTVLSGIALVLITQRDPPPRVWMFALPVAAMVSGAGMAMLLSRLAICRRPGREYCTSAAAIVVMLMLAAHLLHHRSLESGPYAYQSAFLDAPLVAAFLKGTLGPNDKVVSYVPSDAPLEYYLKREAVSHSFLGWRSDRGLSMRPDAGYRLLIVVDPSQNQTVASVLRSVLPDTTRTITESVLVARFPHGAELHAMHGAGAATSP